jgi:YD repeat-containing protein
MPNDLVGAVTGALAGSALASGFHPMAQTESKTQTYQQDARLSYSASNTHSDTPAQHSSVAAEVSPGRMPPVTPTPTPGSSSNPLASPLASSPVSADPLASDFLDRVGQALHQPPANSYVSPNDKPQSPAPAGGGAPGSPSTQVATIASSAAPGPVVNATAAATTAAASAAEASPDVVTHGSPVVDRIVHGAGHVASGSGISPAVTGQSPTQPTSPNSPAYATASSNYGQLPLTFEPNQGQTDSSVNFISQSAGFGFFLTDTAAVFQLTHPAAQGDSTSGDVLALTFDNANTTPEVYGVDDTGARTNYFTGSAATDMLTNVPEYAQVVVQDLYPGINLVLTSTAQRDIEYNFDVAPGASLSEVQLTWNGATSLSLDQQGNLLIGTSGGNVVQDAPVFYQTGSNGQQVPVTGQQVLLGGNTFGFAASGSYDSSSPLVVDPTLDFSTYLGGSGNDDAYGIAVDGTGNSYITGSTASTNFPTTTGAFTSGSGAGTGVFVTKLSSTGNEIYSAYISGTTSGSNAQGNAIAVDLGGNAYVVGTVSGTFPAYNTSTSNDNVPYSSGSNAFLLELNASGDAMPYARYLDPTDTTTNQFGKAIAVTPQGIIYVGGTVSGAYGSSGTIWKTVPGGTITTIQSFGGYSGHVEAITVTGIAATGSWVYLTGSIGGTAITGTTGAYQINDAGLTDAFVFQAPGVALPGGHTAFTFLGGSGADSASGIAIMPSGNILVSGTTSSSNFPTTTGAYQTTLAGTSDAFVAELGSNLNYLAYSTYLGGSGSGGAGTQSATGIAINTSGLITVVGSTTASNFPTSNSLYSFAGATDGFITQFTPNFAGLNYSSLFGGADVGSSLGTATNVVTGVATDLQGDVYLSGYTNSTDFPTSSGDLQGSNAGGYDAFISEILNTPAAPVFTGISPASSASTITITSSQNIQLLGTGTSGATVTVSLRGVGVLGTTTVSGGTWDYNYSGTTLAAGTYDFTATQTISTVVSPPTHDYLVTIAPAGAPTVGLSAPSSTYSLEPSFRVTASDPNGSLGTATVSLLVYNSTGTTLLSTTTGNLLNGYATIKVGTALTVGTSYEVKAQVTGLAGVVGTSSTQNITVGTVSGAWTNNAVAPSSNVNGGMSDLELGNVSDSHGLVLDTNGGTMDGGASLVYNSDSVSQKPIIQTSLQSSNTAALPSTISGTLIWDLEGSDTSTTFSYSVPSGAAPGDLLTLAVQTTATVTTSGRYDWELQVNTPAGVETTTGYAFVDAQDNSVFGSGWTFSPVDQLVSISADSTYGLPAGMLRLYGPGGDAFYAYNGSGYTSPSGDNGTLTAATSGGTTTYTYAMPDGESTTFNNSGEETQWTSSDGLETLQYRYGSGNLTGMTAIDGTVSTFNYASGMVQTIQTSNSRTTTLAMSGTDLTSITDPSGSGSSYTYASHKLTQDITGLTEDEWAYGTSGALATATWGAPTGGGQTNMAKTAYTPAITQGLGGIVVGAPAATTTNYYDDTTLDYLDSQGRPTVEVDPIGATTTVAYDTNGFVTQTTDPLGRTVTDSRDSNEYVTVESSYATGTTTYGYSTGSRHLLTTKTDALGETSTYAYDSLGHLTTATNPLGQVTSYGYSSTTGQETSVTDPLGHTTTNAYNSLRQLTTETDALGNKTTYTYDANGYEATMENALGNVTTMANNVVGDVTKTTNALGNATTMSYDPATGMQTSSTDPLSEVSQTQYDLFDQGQVLDSVAAVGSTVQEDTLNQYNLAGDDTGTRNADGYWSTNVLDPLERVTDTVDSLGDTTQTNYDLAGQEISSRDSVGDWTYNQYNSQGLVTKTIDAEGNVTTMAYNAIGLITSQTDPSGNVTTYLYDALDRVTATTTPLGTNTTMYDAAGNTTETIDPQGNITKMAYDADNRNTSTTTGYGTSQAETTTQAYDAIGDVTSSTDALGNVTTMAYDAIGQNTTTTAPTGLVSAMAYDADGDETVVTNPLSQSTTLAYNALNQQTQTTDANGNVTTQVLDPVGQTVGSIAPDYAVNETVPNSVGQTIYTSDNLGNLTKSVYDANGDLVSQTDPNGNTTQWTYNSNGQKLTETDALGNVTKWAYNSSGWLTAETDPEGNVTTYGYDTQGRQITVETPNGGVTTTAYNSINEVTSVTDPLGHTTSYLYDSQGNQTVVTNALGDKTTMTYNQDNQETSLTDPDGNVTTFAYNTLNEETLTTNPLGHKTTTTYNSNEQVSTVTDPDGREDIYSYDSDGQNTSVVWKNASGTTVNTLTYTYDSSGNVLTAANAAGTYTMAYDADNRVTSVAGLFGVSLTYGYDAVGNRTSVQDSLGGTTTVAYNADNEWSTIEANGTGMSPMQVQRTYTADNMKAVDTRYDSLTASISTEVGITDYSYSGNQDVSNITYKNGSGTVLQQVTYSYDQADRVTTQYLNGTTSSYLYDAVNELTLFL